VIENVQIEARLRVLELGQQQLRDGQFETIWLGRMIAGTLMVQFILAGMERYRKGPQP
jgi:hypothetical protein